jgi:hypothetical protein
MEIKPIRMDEIIFVVEDAPDGGLVARAVGESIFTQAPTMAELHEKVRDAVRRHFEDGIQPRLIRLRPIEVYGDKRIGEFDEAEADLEKVLPRNSAR